MGLQAGHIVFIGTIGKLCFYKSCGQYCVRKSSSLTSKRVKNDKAFTRTMQNAGILARASRIGSSVYKALPETFRQFWMYKAFTGEAIHLLKNGKTDEEARIILWKTYAEIWVSKETSEQKTSTTRNNDKHPGLYVYRKENSISSSLQLRTSNLQPPIYDLPLRRLKRRRRLNNLVS